MDITELLLVARHVAEALDIMGELDRSYDRFAVFDLPRKQGFKVKDMSPAHTQTITIAKKEPFKRLNRRMGRM